MGPTQPSCWCIRPESTLLSPPRKEAGVNEGRVGRSSTHSLQGNRPEYCNLCPRLHHSTCTEQVASRTSLLPSPDPLHGVRCASCVLKRVQYPGSCLCSVSGGGDQWRRSACLNVYLAMPWMVPYLKGRERNQGAEKHKELALTLLQAFLSSQHDINIAN